MKGKTVLVTGGAGYIGSVLVRMLLKEGFFVKVLDILKFGGESIVELINHPYFEFIKGDIRDENIVRNVLKNVDSIVHLAAIVGDPACAKEPDLAIETNLEATKKLYTIALEKGTKRFVYASTCSNYGKMKDPSKMIHEDSELSPVSLYAETKVASEIYLLSQAKEAACKPTCLRFATVYGLSHRIRFDLTVNEFTKELSLGRELVVFGEQFWRPYCHVNDLAGAVLLVLKATIEKVGFQVYNVGDTSENYTKRMIIEEIIQQIPGTVVKYLHKNEDPRDYKVNFDKIRDALNYQITKKVPDGIYEMNQIVKQGLLLNPDDPKYRNS